ncbi:hypothetical protein [Nocardia sp. CC201C]|uniref:DUF6881 domain-containing protein n=1 Tax=Nocardia sp. CC201C TaxID=3044575 RepID=UPI0024A7B6A8|nr:hypothetical protein [Nocardia sp. CC201C]
MKSGSLSGIISDIGSQLTSNGAKGVQLTMSSAGDASIERQRLMTEIIDHVRAQAPRNWRQIDLTYIAVGRAIEMKIGVDTADGPMPGIGGPIDIPRAVDQLRDLMYIPDKGTWFTMSVRISSSGDVSTKFGYSEPEEDTLAGFDLQEDLDIYPREEVPEWMRRLLSSQDSENLLSIQEPDVSAQSFAAPNAPAVDRAVAAEIASRFIPDEVGMRYIKSVAQIPVLNEPAMIFREILENGFEHRKVEIYPDGRVGLAGGLIYTDLTSLEDDPIPSLDELDRAWGTFSAEISPVEFQTEWIASGGWTESE